MPSRGHSEKNTALTQMAQRLHPFRDMIERFGLLLGKQAELAASLQPVDLDAFVIDEDVFLQGTPLVSFVKPDGFIQSFQHASKKVWPLMGVVFPALAPGLQALGNMTETDAQWTGLALQAMMRGDSTDLERAAALAGVAPDFLVMALRAAFGPCVTAYKDVLTALAPMDLWRHPHCPVCGSEADMSNLENHPDPSEFLVSKSGELWHHCPTCTHRWRFVRLTCPSCGNADHETLSKFSSEELPHEYFYACEHCHHYLPGIDLVERSEPVDFDLAALGLIHLDAVAQSKGYVPLSPAPWVAMDFNEDSAPQA
ncbi:formate dehydrogenase accessory protein FdhE [Desulfovibrionales bacterium]